MATHSGILAWKTPRAEEPGGLQPMGSQSRTPLSDFTFFLTFKYEEDGLQFLAASLSWCEYTGGRRILSLLNISFCLYTYEKLSVRPCRTFKDRKALFLPSKDFTVKRKTLNGCKYDQRKLRLAKPQNLKVNFVSL